MEQKRLSYLLEIGALKHKYHILYFEVNMTAANQNPEQLARDRIEQLLIASGRLVQSKKQINLVACFKARIEAHKTAMLPLQVFYAQPYRRRELSYVKIRVVAERIKINKPTLAPLQYFHPL